MIRAALCDIACHLPVQVLDNATLAAGYEHWTPEKILEKTGIRERRIAAEGETAGDLAFAAAEALFRRGRVAREDVDFVILCTQAPDYVLPTTACVLQHRLGIPTRAGAFDMNLGCSGYVYGLALAKSLVETGLARCVLLLTADTYSKYIHPADRSVRTLFGDGAAATAVVADDTPGPSALGPFVFGTDGSGAGSLIVEAGGFRLPRSPETARTTVDASGNEHSRDHLVMDGSAVMAFALREVPKAVHALLARAGRSLDDVDHLVFHQANRFMLDALRRKVGATTAQVPVHLEAIGNTVSSTIPFVLAELMARGRLLAGTRLALVGFGVGLSWAAAWVELTEDLR